MTSFKRSQSKYVKQSYKVRNWPEYEAALRQRGSLTVWLGLDAAQTSVPGWDAKEPAKKKRGRQKIYSKHAIETTVRIGMVFRLPSRQNEGFMKSLFELLQLTNKVPDHTTLCRRRSELGKVPLGASETGKPVHILIDSSGLSVHVGQQRKPPKSRDYRKIHLVVDEETGDILACDLTSKSARDPSRVPSLLRQIDRPIASARLDAAYDANGVYRAIENHTEGRRPRVLIPPKKNAKLAPRSPTTRERNRNIRSRVRLGRRKWHAASGYSKRCKVETTFYRYKAILGPTMRARKLAGQRVEARIGCQILNRMAALGMPDGQMLG